MNRHDPLGDPSTIEREIVHTRASLHRKLDELQHRLNPRERMRTEAQRVTSAVRSEARRVQSAVRGVDTAPLAGVAALAAVGVGTVMAVNGFRRRNHREDLITPGVGDAPGE
jgi:hypothetical protein